MWFKHLIYFFVFYIVYFSYSNAIDYKKNVNSMWKKIKPWLDLNRLPWTSKSTSLTITQRRHIIKCRPTNECIQDNNDTCGLDYSVTEWEWDGLIHLKTTLTWFQCFDLSLRPFSNENVSWTGKWAHTLSQSQFETTTMDTETETASWTRALKEGQLLLGTVFVV